MKWQGETTEMFWDRVCDWHRAFAWLPVQTETGEWLWMVEYERRSMRAGPTILDIDWINREVAPKAD